MSHFTRLTLRRDDLAVAPLLATLAPRDGGMAMATTHRLLWTVMPDEVRRRHHRDKVKPRTSAFLWREAEKGKVFYLLGPAPLDESPYFSIETKPWQPDLAVGDRLRFDLRVNATVNRRVGQDGEGRAVRRRSDIAMDMLHSSETTGATGLRRAAARPTVAETAACRWFVAQGASSGFRVDVGAVRLSGYRTERLPRSGGSATIGVFDLVGDIEVTDPEIFVARVRSGFGRAKAFGCGLMLLRRAPPA